MDQKCLSNALEVAIFVAYTCFSAHLPHLLARLESTGPTYCWNELITLSTKYRDLTANSQLALTVSWLFQFICSYCICFFHCVI